MEQAKSVLRCTRWQDWLHRQMVALAEARGTSISETIINAALTPPFEVGMYRSQGRCDVTQCVRWEPQALEQVTLTAETNGLDFSEYLRRAMLFELTEHIERLTNPGNGPKI